MKPEDSVFITMMTKMANEIRMRGEGGLESLDGIEDKILDGVEELAGDFVNHMNSRVPSNVRFRMRSEQRAKRNTVKRFWRGFALYEQALAAAEVVNEKQLDSTLQTLDKKTPLLGIDELFGGPPLRCLLLTSLHARSILVAGEILHCLKGGYPEAASSRARSLYEIAAIAWFLAQAGPDEQANIELCERYYVSVQVEATQLGIAANEMDKRLRVAARKNWGTSFFEPYGWARSVLSLQPKERAGFRHIDRHIGASTFRHFYLEFNNAIHAGAFNTVSRTDFRRRPIPNPTRPECDPTTTRRVGWAGLNFLELTTYATTRAIARTASRWDDMLHFAAFRKITDSALVEFGESTSSQSARPTG